MTPRHNFTLRGADIDDDPSAQAQKQNARALAASSNSDPIAVIHAAGHVTAAVFTIDVRRFEAIGAGDDIGRYHLEIAAWLRDVADRLDAIVADG